MITYRGYRIVPTTGGYGVQTEHHNINGSVEFRHVSGPYRTIEQAKAACRAHFGRL